MKRKIIFSIISIFVFFYNFVFAYDEKIGHPRIIEKAAKRLDFERYLITNLGFIDGLKTRFLKVSKNNILEWLQEGSRLEDSPWCRATNHFHNPLKPWDQSFLTDEPLWLGVHCRSWKPWYSNITWATGFLSPAGPRIIPTKQWMGWHDARDYYYWALTSISNTHRETYFAKTFQALGQVLT